MANALNQKDWQRHDAKWQDFYRRASGDVKDVGGEGEACSRKAECGSEKKCTTREFMPCSLAELPKSLQGYPEYAVS